MGTKRRVCRLSDSRFRNVDLRQFEKQIIDTINEAVPGKNPRVTTTNFSTDELTQSEAIKLGRALAKLEDLAVYGKEIRIFRLFEGHLQDAKETVNSEETTSEVKDSNNSIVTETTISHEVKTETKVKGGHMA